MRVGILTEYPSPAVLSGPALHTRFLYQGLKARGHVPVLMGPDTTAEADMGDAEHHLYRAFPYPTHPRVKVAMPGPSLRHMWRPPQLDVIHSQTSTHMSHYASWIREMWQVPVLNTHVIHMPTHSHFIVSDKLWDKAWVRDYLRKSAHDVERNFAAMYNDGDALIVQSRFYVDYWRERGVTVPIHVVGRPIDPGKFSAQAQEDPYPAHFKAGKRLVVVCRHDREKRLDHLIRIFAERIAPADPEATLTVVGDGHDHRNLVMQAMATPAARRIHFPGEISHERLVDWYGHGDVFVYTSLSETFGNVVNEALWCGLPVVALDDRMGVAHQLANEVNGFLVPPDHRDTDDRFASAALLLTRSPALRQRMGEQGMNLSRRTSHPDQVLSRFEQIYAEARHHVLAGVPVPLSARSRAAQARAFARRVGTWTAWNTFLLGLAHTATRLGATRTGGSHQHAEVQAELTTRQAAEAHTRAA